MTLVGLDFDNTLVHYDKLFHQLALEKGLIGESVAPNKTAVRDFLRRQGKDEQFTELQGEVYGLRILEAEPAEGMLQALTILHQKGIRMLLVSHKTRKPYRGPEYDLHKAAWAWLEKHRFLEISGLNWSSKNIFFEESKSEKLNRIKICKCSHYVDDLPEILVSYKIDKIEFSAPIEPEPLP